MRRGRQPSCCVHVACATAIMQVKSDPYQRPDEARPLPSRITLYQYEVCPYCCKVRAFLDFYKVNTPLCIATKRHGRKGVPRIRACMSSCPLATCSC